MQDLWLAMTQAYGHAWTSTRGKSDAHGVWLRAIQAAGISGAALFAGYQRALKRTRTDGSRDPMPPGLPEFLDLCQGGDRKRTGAHKFFPPGLPRPWSAKETAAPYLAELKRRFGVKR